MGEKHYTPGQKVRKKPVLDKETVWRIPKGFKVPPVKIIFKKLNKAEGARRKKELATLASRENDVEVANNATSTSPKHDLKNKPPLTEEVAHQVEVIGKGRTDSHGYHGLKRLGPNPKGEIVQDSLNRLASQIGWDRVGEMEESELVARLIADNQGSFTEMEVLALFPNPSR